MTPTLPQLGGLAGMKSSGGNEQNISSSLGGQSNGESFDSLMTRAVSSATSKSKNSDSGAQATIKGQSKKDSASVTPDAGVSVALAASLPLLSIPPIIPPPMPQVQTGSVPSVDDSSVLKAQIAGDGLMLELKPQAVDTSVGKAASIASPSGKSTSSAPAPVPNKPDGGKALAAALGLEAVKTSADTQPKVAQNDSKPVVASGNDKVVPDVKMELSPAEPGLGAKAEKPPEVLDAVPNASGTSELPAAGTPIAKSGVAMKKPEQTIKVAETTGKNLPGDAVSTGLKKGLFVQSPDVSSDSNSGNTGLTGSSANDTGRLAAVDAVAVPEASGSRLLERTQEMVIQNAMRTSSLTNESLHVVIKPGEGTQLSLELRQRGDGVEVQAVLQQGDFNNLSQGWGDLQEHLKQRGIHLGTLESENNFSGNGETSFQERQSNAGGRLEEDSTAMPYAGQPVLAVAPSTESVSVLSGKSGWQMWA